MTSKPVGLPQKSKPVRGWQPRGTRWQPKTVQAICRDGRCARRAGFFLAADRVCTWLEVAAAALLPPLDPVTTSAKVKAEVRARAQAMDLLLMVKVRAFVIMVREPVKTAPGSAPGAGPHGRQPSKII